MFRLAAENKNVVGFIMDDFFHGDIDESKKVAADVPMKASLTSQELRDSRPAPRWWSAVIYRLWYIPRKLIRVPCTTFNTLTK